jgi:hypothetical protein
MVVVISGEDRGRLLRAEFCPDDSLVGVGDGLEDGVAVEKVREIDIPDDVGVSEGWVEEEGGVSKLEGIGMGEVSEGTWELKEPVMLLMVKKEEY